MRSFYATSCKTDCLQILYKFGINWISVPNIVHQLILSLRCDRWKIQNCGDFQDAINSIRRPADGRSEAMTSVFCDVIRLEAVRDGLNVLIEGHFGGFGGGIWTPKWCRPSCGPQKGTSLCHNACFEPSWVKFHVRVTSVGESGEKIKRDALYFTYFARRPLQPTGTIFLLRVRLLNVINYAKFYRNRLRGFDSVSGRSLTIPIGLWCRR